MKVNGSLNKLNLDGFDLPIKELKGVDAVDKLDFSSKGLGIASAIVIAECLKVNGSLNVLDLEGAFPICLYE